MVCCSVCFATKTSSVKKRSFHVLPTDFKVKQLWIAYIRRERGGIVKVDKNTAICSKHFNPSDIQKKKKFHYIVPGAVPCNYEEPSPPAIKVEVEEEEQEEEMQSDQVPDNVIDENPNPMYEMFDETKCFVCQSKPQSADGSPYGIPMMPTCSYKSLDAPSWKIFCHYFYPPPLAGFFEDSNEEENIDENTNKENPTKMPVFCGDCRYTIFNLCNLHNVLESLQSQISKIVAQVSVAIVQDENAPCASGRSNKSSNFARPPPVKRKRQEQDDQKLGDNVIFSMRRCIQQRYRPSVSVIRSNIGIPNQSGGGSSNGLKISQGRSQLSTHSSSFDLDSGFDVDFFGEIKQEVEDSRMKLARAPHNPNADLNKPSLDPEVGENIYERAGKWRYEKKPDESGAVRFYCLSCPKNYPYRHHVARHIDDTHIHELPIRPTRTQKIDEDNFIYDGSYSITRVTEPTGVFYKCGTCEAKKKTLDIMKQHVKENHIEPKKFVCDQCGFSCPTSYRLRMHMEIHGEVRKEKHICCEECGKLFLTEARLKIHKECHEAEPYKCECGRTFVYSKSLWQHRKKAKHPIPSTGIETPFAPKTCRFCKRELVTEESLLKHETKCPEKMRKQGVKTMCNWCRGFFTRVDKHKIHSCPMRFKFKKQDSVASTTKDVEERPVEVAGGVAEEEHEKE